MRLILVSTAIRTLADVVRNSSAALSIVDSRMGKLKVILRTITCRLFPVAGCREYHHAKHVINLPPPKSVMRALILGCVTATLCCASGWAAEPPTGANVSKALLAAIGRVSPNATILQANQVDAKSCAPVPKSPGLVRADFNGDGLEDAAALLKIRVAEEITVWEGKELREADFVFVIFLNDGKGGHIARTLDKFSDFIPAGVTISINPPGKIRPLGAKKDITLSNPSIVLTYCEKSAAAYVVTGTRVKEIPLSD